MRIEGLRIGYVRKDRLKPLAECSQHFVVGEQQVDFVLAGSAIERSAAIAETVAALHRRGEIIDLLGEKLPVDQGWGTELLFELERTAVPWFGVGAYGVHLNGYVRTPKGLEMWIAVRAGGRSTFPGKLDNLVAGGQPAGISLRDNLLKECLEEANIPEDLAQTAVPAGMIGYCAESERGLKPDTIFCYDIELPPDFVPTNRDGEVQEFHRWPIEDVATRVRDTHDFKFNCNLVIIDFLLRHGFIGPQDEHYQEIVSGLWQPIVINSR